MSIKHLGFDDWFVEASKPHRRDGWAICRVLTVNRTNWIISDGTKDIRSELTGRLQYSVDSALERPAVGDWVNAQLFDDDTFAVIDQVLPRKTVLKRKAAGTTVEFQLLACNVDTLLIVQSCDSDFNPRRLERYLVMARDGDVDPVVLLSKCDQMNEADCDSLVQEVHSLDSQIPVITFSALLDLNMDKVRQYLVPGHTCCLMGSSGVGKTTLLNTLVGEALFETQDVRSSDHKGRHTTTRRHLVALKNGALLIDTPGIRELGTVGAEYGISGTFADIVQLARTCRFKDCNHETEAGCAVLAALESGDIDSARLGSYKKLQRETLRNEMSLAQRRKKDKNQGKLYKSIIQSKKNRR